MLVKYDDQVDHYSEYRNATPVKVNLLGIFWPSDNNSDVKLLDGTRKKKAFNMHSQLIVKDKTKQNYKK